MDMIYQYTSLETLALILKYKTIRFNNLCNLDDPLEKYVRIRDFDSKDHHLTYVRSNYGRFCFVSCWTMNRDESISMWDMYGDRKRGVRIGLARDMFDKNYNVNKNKSVIRPLFDVQIEKVQPEFITIDYTRIDDPKLVLDDWRIEIGNLGKYKTKDWSFQEECRFRLFGSKEKSTKSRDVFYVPSQVNDIQNIVLDTPSSKQYVDFGLNPDVLRDINIIIGPNMSDGNRFLLQSLKEHFSIGDNQVKESRFADL